MTHMNPVSGLTEPPITAEALTALSTVVTAFETPTGLLWGLQQWGIELESASDMLKLSQYQMYGVGEPVDGLTTQQLIRLRELYVVLPLLNEMLLMRNTAHTIFWLDTYLLLPVVYSYRPRDVFKHAGGMSLLYLACNRGCEEDVLDVFHPTWMIDEKG